VKPYIDGKVARPLEKIISKESVQALQNAGPTFKWISEKYSLVHCRTAVREEIRRQRSKK
jgi:hypothetical protein